MSNIGPKPEPSQRRDLIIARIAERLLFPSSKLANTRHWHDTTRTEELGVADADEDQLYDAMDWLLERQEMIEKKLAEGTSRRGPGPLRRHPVRQRASSGMPPGPPRDS
jgi:hypothetical protein